MQVKTEVDGIYRDMNNGALLNRDNSGLSAYKKMKNKYNEMDAMKNDIDTLKGDMSTIKNLLQQLVENSK